jgi:hypothetical protein
VLANSLQVLGEDHPDTMKSRNVLKHASTAWGRPAGTMEIEWRGQNLGDRVRVLGEDHPDTMKSRDPTCVLGG